MLLTQQQLKTLISYDPVSGVVTWVAPRQGIQVGMPLGSRCVRNRNIYLETKIEGCRFYLHRLIFFYVTGRWAEEVDHKNGDGLDNSWLNLREVNKQEQGRNTKRKSNNRSGITGVYWAKQSVRWVANICINYKTIYLGCSDSLFEVCCLRKAAELKYNFHVNHGRSS